MARVGRPAFDIFSLAPALLNRLVARMLYPALTLPVTNSVDKQYTFPGKQTIVPLEGYLRSRTVRERAQSGLVKVR